MTIIALLLILILIALVFGGEAVVSLFQLGMKLVILTILTLIFIFFIGLMYT